MSPDRSSLSLPSEASDSLSRPACKDGDELSARMAIVKKYFGGDRAASCISGINHWTLPRDERRVLFLHRRVLSTT